MAMTSRQQVQSSAAAATGANRATSEQRSRGGRSSDGELVPMGAVGPTSAGGHAAGWVTYGGVRMLILGAMYLLFSVVVIAFSEWSVWADRAVLLFNPDQWGWIFLGVGAVVVAAAVGVLNGSTRGRQAGALVVAGAMLVSFLALSAFPLWAIVKMVIGGVVLYCLVARGGPAGQHHLEVARHT